MAWWRVRSSISESEMTAKWKYPVVTWSGEPFTFAWFCLKIHPDRSAYRRMTWSFPGNFSRWRRAHPTFLGRPEWLKRIAHSQPKSSHIFMFRNQGNRNRFPKTLGLRGWCMVSPSASWTSCHRGPGVKPSPAFFLIWGQTQTMLPSPELEGKT